MTATCSAADHLPEPEGWPDRGFLASVAAVAGASVPRAGRAAGDAAAAAAARARSEALKRLLGAAPEGLRPADLLRLECAVALEAALRSVCLAGVRRRLWRTVCLSGVRRRRPRRCRCGKVSVLCRVGFFGFGQSLTPDRRAEKRWACPSSCPAALLD
jgi:hypothetical protein